MLLPNSHYRCIRWIGCLWTLLLLFFPVAGTAVCTEAELDLWWQEDGWRPGAAVWAGSDNIRAYDAIPDGDGPAEESYKGDLSFSAPSLPIQDKQKKEGKIWLRVRRENDFVWVPAGHPGVLCRSAPLKSERSHLLRKVIPRVENHEGKEPFVPVRRRPEMGQGITKQNIRTFDYFFVYAEHGDWRLLGRGDVLSPFQPRLLGWARQSDLIRWDSRAVVRPKPGARFLKSPGDVQEPIAWTTKGWGAATRRPPITGSSKIVAGKEYLPVILPVNFEAHRRHSKNLETLARAEGAWRRPVIVFLVDGTHSTRPYLAAIHKLLNRLLDELDAIGRQRGLTLRYALYAYTDAAYGPADHTRRYQGATEHTWSLRQAFQRLEANTQEIMNTPVKDDYPEDLYSGIQRVRDEVLTDTVRKDSLPVLIVIGDHGGHERAVRRKALRPFLDTIVPYFIQLGQQDEQVRPNCRYPDDLTHREKRHCAFQRFEADARDLLGKDLSGETKFAEGKNFFQGVDPEVLAGHVEGVLRDVLQQQTSTPRAVDTLATGQPWETARRAADWPLAYSDAFRRLLLAQGYDEKTLAEGDFVAVREGWIAKEEGTQEVFLTKQELYRWIALFERMARSENWSAERVREIFAGSIGVYARESVWRLPLSEVLKKRAGLPLQNTELLNVTPEAIRHLNQEDVRYYALLFAGFRDALAGVARGALSEVGVGRYADTGKGLLIRGEPEHKDLWFDFAPGVEAAYVELRHLP